MHFTKLAKDHGKSWRGIAIVLNDVLLMWKATSVTFFNLTTGSESLIGFMQTLPAHELITDFDLFMPRVIAVVESGMSDGEFNQKIYYKLTLKFSCKGRGIPSIS
jgi:hypothetical protein